MVPTKIFVQNVGVRWKGIHAYAEMVARGVGFVRGGAPVHEEMHNIYHILYLNPLLEHFLGWSDFITLIWDGFTMVDLWWIWSVEMISQPLTEHL